MTKRRVARQPRLPVQQLAILAACRFAEPIAATSVFPYLPEMIESFGVEKDDVAKWAGITSAVFSLSQCCTAILWGRASDSFGRKPVILIGLFFTMLTSVFWGLSPNLPWAIAIRTLSGGSNGNVGIIRTMVAEMVPEKELQPRAFSVMPLVWSLGSIFGPAFGGALSNPVRNMPAFFGNSRFLKQFPFVLPNLIAAGFFLMGLTVGLLFLKETLETKKHKPDYGRMLGKLLVGCFKRKKKNRPIKHFDIDEEQGAALLTRTSTNSSKALDDDWTNPKPLLPPPRIWEVFTKQSTINLLCYTFLALHSTAFDQLLPIFMHHPRQIPDEHNTHLPFRFSGGFGLDSGRIGTLFTLYGICGGFVQFLIFPPVARRCGILNCLKFCVVIFPLIYLATPYTALIQDSALQQGVMFALMTVKSFCGIFAFPCSTILLTNSALSLRILGTLNGVATSVSAVGRGIGPFISGAAFTWGVEQDYVITSWWTLAAISALGAIPVFWLVEMDGFNSNSDSESDDDDEDEEDDGLEALPVIPEENAIIAGDELLEPDPSEEALDVIEGAPLTPIKTRSSSVPRPKRRLSSPLGVRGGSIGPGGARRLSNGLGHSNFGQGTGGTTFH